MTTKLKKNNKGFTIIEVLIVLAIAGLILLIVFLAVPALQRNSRNTQRRNDVQKMIGTLQEAANNNNGIPPVDTAVPPVISGEKYSQYDPANINYKVVAANTANDLPGNVALNAVLIRNGMRCTDNAQSPNDDPVTITLVSATSTGGEIATKAGATSRNTVAIYAVETQSGKIQAQCINS